MIGEIQAIVGDILENGRYLGAPDDPAQRPPVLGNGIEVTAEGIGMVVRGCCRVSPGIPPVIDRVLHCPGTGAVVLEVTHDDVLDIPDVPGVGPFQAGVFRRDVLQHGNPGLAADAPSPFQVGGIEIPLQVQVVCEGAFDKGWSVPTAEPLFYLIVLDPLPDDLAIPVG